MSIRFYNPYTPGTRNRSVSDFQELTSSRPEKSLTHGQHRAYGRNSRGVITARHRSCGHKRLYRQIDFYRQKVNAVGKVNSIQYDPNRSSNIALIHYQDGEKRYIVHPRGLGVGDSIVSGVAPPIQVGNALPLASAPLGTMVHCVELRPGQGARLARSAGSGATVVAKEGAFVTLRLPSGEVRLIPRTCWATIGQVGNEEKNKIRLGKAGRGRWLGRRPHVRGVVMNPCDHPHGGGEGRAPIGRKHPVTLWGRPALGPKTRKPHRYSDKAIIRRRSA